VDGAHVPSLQLVRVSVGGTGVSRRTAENVFSAADTVRELLAAVLLVPRRDCEVMKMGLRQPLQVQARTLCEAAGPDERHAILTNPQFSSNYTSNDLLARLQAEASRKTLHYKTVAQSAEEVQDVRNAPAISMGPYLISSGQTQLLTTISIYSQRGKGRDQVRLLYMNAAALQIWQAMGQRPTLIGAQHRPPSTALLTFGVPFSD
jgi:hypothetical protein